MWRLATGQVELPGRADLLGTRQYPRLSSCASHTASRRPCQLAHAERHCKVRLAHLFPVFYSPILLESHSVESKRAKNVEGESSMC